MMLIRREWRKHIAGCRRWNIVVHDQCYKTVILGKNIYKKNSMELEVEAGNNQLLQSSYYFMVSKSSLVLTSTAKQVLGNCERMVFANFLGNMLSTFIL